MRVIRPAPEAEVVASFLRGELDSPRYRKRLLDLLAADGQDASLVARPNLGDRGENAYRAALLDRHRGWSRREGLFHAFPQHIDWFRAALSREEVLAIRYIDWDWWLDISGGTRQPLDAARRIRHGTFTGSTAEGHEPIAARLRAAKPPVELIAVTPSDHSRLVLVEGHVRLTACALYPDSLPPALEILLGVSDEIERWWAFQRIRGSSSPDLSPRPGSVATSAGAATSSVASASTSQRPHVLLGATGWQLPRTCRSRSHSRAANLVRTASTAPSPVSDTCRVGACAASRASTVPA